MGGSPGASQERGARTAARIAAVCVATPAPAVQVQPGAEPFRQLPQAGLQARGQACGKAERAAAAVLTAEAETQAALTRGAHGHQDIDISSTGSHGIHRGWLHITPWRAACQQKNPRRHAAHAARTERGWPSCLTCPDRASWRGGRCRNASGTCRCGLPCPRTGSCR